jgi:hypothetical protein
MYGDTGAIRRLAGGLRDRADQIRGEADRLVARTDHAGWLGRAGDALRARVRGRALALRRTASLHDEAAEALDRHAREVDRLVRLIEEIERRVGRLIEAARDTMVDRVTDWVSRWFDRFDPPPSGSRLWLEVEVPGQ